MKLPAGYLLPEGKTMADVRQLDQELLASEALEVQGLRASEGDREIPREEK